MSMRFTTFTQIFTDKVITNHFSDRSNHWTGVKALSQPNQN